MRREATFSECRKYRYILYRDWTPEYRCIYDQLKKTIVWIMLNPSIADDIIDDPTIRRCISFSKLWGYDCLYIYNIFALRATDPKELKKIDDPIGIKNDTYLDEVSVSECKIVVAWGNHGTLYNRDKKIIEIFKDRSIYCLGTNKSGQPKHPLYISQKTELELYK